MTRVYEMALDLEVGRREGLPYNGDKTRCCNVDVVGYEGDGRAALDKNDCGCGDLTIVHFCNGVERVAFLNDCSVEWMDRKSQIVVKSVENVRNRKTDRASLNDPANLGKCRSR